MLIINAIVILLTFPASAQNPLIQYFYVSQAPTFPAAGALFEQSLLSAEFHNDFCLKELIYKSLSYDFVKNRNCGFLVLDHFGYSKYGNFSLSAGYARCFGHKLSISLAGDYLVQHAEHYPSLHSFTIDISGILLINNNAGILISLYNPIRMHYGVVGQSIIPMQFNIESYYQIDSKLISYMLCKKTLPGNLEIGGGLNCYPTKHLYVNIFCSQIKIGAGAATQWKHFILGTSANWNYKLGISTQSHLNYLF